MDYLLVSLSVLGAGLAFGTPAAFDGSKPRRPWSLSALRLVAVAAMIIPGAMVSDLFGPADSATSYWHTAVALWLPAMLLTGIFEWPGAKGAPPAPDDGAQRTSGDETQRPSE